MITVTMIGILLGLAVPAFKEAIRNNRIVAQNNEFISALNYARSEAIRRSDTVSVCSSTNGTGCSTTTNWSTGWITFLDLNANGILDGAEAVMQTSPPVMPGITLESPPRAIRHEPAFLRQRNAQRHGGRIPAAEDRLHRCHRAGDHGECDRTSLHRQSRLYLRSEGYLP